MRAPRVLVADDDADIRDLVNELLARSGYDVVEASDGQEALRQFFSHRPDLVVLDVSMPGLDGWEVLGRIRELSDVPVVMLTARVAEPDKVRGLRSGADDYITKPFGSEELLARVDAQLRRASPSDAAETYSDGLVSIDFAQRTVISGGREVGLTPLEFKLLAAFVAHPNQVLSHEQLLELAWGGGERVSREQVKLYVGYLRRKLGDVPGGDSPIETVRGFGYRYRPATAD